jgi:GntR family transcriptional regulator/MocR family aminotransferase
MPVEWSGLSPHLLIQLDRESGTPLRAQLEGHLRSAIQTGRLTQDERLPSSRSLAVALAVSRGLVQECYAQLQAEGYLTSRGGSATRVAASQVEPRSTPRRTPPPAVPPPPRWIADFASGVPDLRSAPREDWAWAVREACRHAPNTTFDYGDPRGDPRLREVVAAYLRRVRAVDAGPDQLVVCGGFAQGLALVLRALAAAGLSRVAAEDPGSFGSIGRAAPQGGEMVPVPVDELGIDVAALDASGARVVVLTPAHQWPTGVVLAGERRHQLIAWARERDAYVIEDDYDAEFRYDREPVGSLQGLCPDRVVTLGTVSKSLTPALRLGWVVVPDVLADDVVAAKLAADRGTPGLDQFALATLIESGRYDRHLRRMRAEYAARRDVLVDALAGAAPDLPVTGLAAGFHAVLHLPAGTDEQALVGAAADRSVRLYGMSTYRSTGEPTPPQLVFGFGNTSQREIAAGIGAIADLLADA